MRVTTTAADRPAPAVVRSIADVPFQPPVATLTYELRDGGTKRFQVMPFLNDPGFWSTPFASLAAARDAAHAKAQKWDGYVTFGVHQAKEGHYLIRPMESEHGNPFVIDRDLLGEVGAVNLTATATADELRAIVGRSDWLDFSDPGNRIDVRPTPLRG